MLYPFRPPEVRFLTKIFHPNVNRHGDIGIDSIQQGNWVSGLTLTKVLISIQSLLTDPYCEVCMEPEVGELYNTDKEAFDIIARYIMLLIKTDNNLLLHLSESGRGSSQCTTFLSSMKSY